jgi:hypothetical protein
MARISIPERFRDKLGIPYYDARWLDVRLRDGRVYWNLRAREYFITGRNADPDGEGPLDFEADDIISVRPHSWLRLLLPWWW